MSAYREYQVAFCTISWTCHDVQYSNLCFDSSNLFACVGLRNKQYCILNKQYSKEEYEEMIPRIKAQMKERPYIDSLGRSYGYGEFFPSELSPFAYNETVAQEYFPLTGKEARARGFYWRDPKERNYTITVNPEELPSSIQRVKDYILTQIIGCAHEGNCNHQCTTAFRIIPQELQLHRQMNIPLSPLCPNCRHYQRIKQRNPLKLWTRHCNCAGTKSDNGAYKNSVAHFHKTNHCPNSFQTTYEPDRPEVIYCEQCHQTEVV